MRAVFSALILVVLALPADAAAQPSGKPSKVRPVTVSLLDRAPDIRGRLVDINNDTVTITVDGRPVRVPLVTVRKVRIDDDSVLNGTVIGAIAGGVYCSFICGQGLTREQSIPGAIVKAAGMGALLGAMIDAANSPARTLYEARDTPGGGLPPLRFSIRF